MEGLTVGRIVHYIVEGKVEGKLHLAAVVCRVRDADKGIVDLAVFAQPYNNSDVSFAPVFTKTAVAHDPEYGNHTWHWIERA